MCCLSPPLNLWTCFTHALLQFWQWKKFNCVIHYILGTKDHCEEYDFSAPYRLYNRFVIFFGGRTTMNGSKLFPTLKYISILSLLTLSYTRSPSQVVSEKHALMLKVVGAEDYSLFLSFMCLSCCDVFVFMFPCSGSFFLHCLLFLSEYKKTCLVR